MKKGCGGGGLTREKKKQKTSFRKATAAILAAYQRRVAVPLRLYGFDIQRTKVVAQGEVRCCALQRRRGDVDVM